MEQVKAIFWIYKTCLIRTVELVRDNLGIIFAPLAYGMLLSAAAMLASQGRSSDAASFQR